MIPIDWEAERRAEEAAQQEAQAAAVLEAERQRENKLNQFNGDFVEAEMVKAFITSGEYRSALASSEWESRCWVKTYSDRCHSVFGGRGRPLDTREAVAFFSLT